MFELRGTMCAGAEEKVDGLKLIQSAVNSETLYAMVSPELAPRLLSALNSHDELIEALQRLIDSTAGGDNVRIDAARQLAQHTLHGIVLAESLP